MIAITHKNRDAWLDRLRAEPFFQIGNKTPYDPGAWYNQTVVLEVPTGELARDGLTTIALIGRSPHETAPLTGKEGFNAQGLEEKVVIHKPLVNALLNLDIIPEKRGRVVIDATAEKKIRAKMRDQSLKVGTTTKSGNGS